MSDTSIRKREFRSDVPESLLKNASEFERHVYTQLSVQRQQNEAILSRLDYGDVKLKTLSFEAQSNSERIAVFEKFKERITAKWTVIAFIACALAGPVTLAFLGAAFIRWFERMWK